MSNNMSWAQAQPQQRYSLVPGFERPESRGSGVGTSIPGTPDERPAAGQYELDNFDPRNPPPAHRASLYSDSFVNGNSSPSPSQQAALLNDSSSMYSNGSSRPARNQYAAMDGPNAAGGGYPAPGYGNNFSNQQPHYEVGHGTQGATADDLWKMEGGNGQQKYAADQAPKSSKKWIWIGLAVLLLCIGAGVGAGVGISQSNKNKSSSSSGSSGSTGTGSTSTGDSSTTVATGSDPSVFTKDDRLKQSFWGLAYTPKDSIYPNCWANISTVTKDIQLLSQLTTRIRLYGAACDTTALVMQAVKDTKVDMTIYPAIYINSDDTTKSTSYTDQVSAIEKAFATYGVDNVGGVAVGNEYLLIAMTAAGSGDVDPKKPSYTPAVKKLSAFITDFRTKLTSWNLSKTIPVGTGDAGSLMSVELAQYIDYYMANVHPWFADGVTISNAASWTDEFFQNWDVLPSTQSANKPEVYIAETGWPTGASPPTSESGVDNRPTSQATVAALQTFLDTWVCQANANNTKYFYFEPFDEKWKDIKYGGVEGYWGLFDENRNLKDITIPVC